MSKLIFQVMLSLDGCFEGKDGNLDWHRVDEEFKDYSAAFLNSAGTLLFGRRTYEVMSTYWPTAAAQKEDPVVAELMLTIPKLVVSSTITNGTMLPVEILPFSIAEIRKRKQNAEKDIALIGSAQLATALAEADLIDEFHFIVNPVILGNGKHIFSSLEKPLDLRLIDCWNFNSGAVLQRFAPA